MNREHGFTLVELLVVIAIIGILASISLVTLAGTRAKSRDARRISDIRTIGTALHLYNNDNSQYPDTLAELVTEGHIPAIPTDPLTGNSYGYDSANCAPPNQAFVLQAELERDHGALNSDIDGTRCGINCNDRFYCIDQ